MPRLIVITEVAGAREFERVTGSANLVVLAGRALAGAEEPLLDLAARRRCVLVAAGEGMVRGAGLAVALLADWFVMEESASVDPSGSAAAMAGLIWRIGRCALPLQVAGAFPARAVDAAVAGICDEVVGSGADWVKWSRGWLGNRSIVALEAAARLIRLRGGDELERAEFARLFAAGEPQKGLGAFLRKRRPEFTSTEDPCP